MERFVIPKTRLEIDSAAAAAVATFAARQAQRRESKAAKAWHKWSAVKKEQVWALYSKEGYKACLQKYGADCPPRSTVKGWSSCSTAISRPGRPTRLSVVEEQALDSAIADIRSTGASLDRGQPSLSL